MIVTVIWSHPTFTPRIGTVDVGRNGGKFTSLFPYQSSPTPRTMSRRPTVATTFRVAPTQFRGARPSRLHQQPLGWTEDQDAHGGGEAPRPSVFVVQPVEDEHGEGSDGTVGQVEDARCLVGEHEADPCEPVDRTGCDADHDERQEVPASLSSPPSTDPPCPQAMAMPTRSMTLTTSTTRLLRRDRTLRARYSPGKRWVSSCSE